VKTWDFLKVLSENGFYGQLWTRFWLPFVCAVERQPSNCFFVFSAEKKKNRMLSHTLRGPTKSRNTMQKHPARYNDPVGTIHLWCCKKLFYLVGFEEFC
jgi:hypothetical protein